jgi:hypothetical protein
VINSLREENLCLQDELKIIKGKKKKLNRLINANKSENHMLIEDVSLDESDEINVILDASERLEEILDKKLKKDLAAIVNISRDFLSTLKNDPNSSKIIEQSINSLEESINKLA